MYIHTCVNASVLNYIGSHHSPMVDNKGDVWLPRELRGNHSSNTIICTNILIIILYITHIIYAIIYNTYML